VLEDRQRLRDVACSYQEAVMDVLVRRTEYALKQGHARTLAAVGGVACNRRLRSGLEEMTRSLGVQLLLTPPEYCTDNAAMVAGLGGALLAAGLTVAQEMDISPGLRL
jgi:N6-L-threonylcarbamoyladenine synthase